MIAQECKRCLYTTNHPFGLVIDEEGICSGCRIHEEKDTLDWNKRWEDLVRLVAPYKLRDSRNYDCIVPVSGGGDSFFIVHIVKEKLGMKPLLVSHNRQYNTKIGIQNLARLRQRFDCDILIQTVNPASVKKVARSTLRMFGSFHWPAIAGQTSFPVQVAITHKIPLILWGAHQGQEQVGMFSHLHNAEMTRRYRKDHDLMGYEADDLLTLFDGLSEKDIWQYRYPENHLIADRGVRGIYLGNYIRWDPIRQHKDMVRLAGYKGAWCSRTFDVFDHVDDCHYMGLHDYIKQRKTGYGKVLDHACREIRHNRISRENAISLVSRFQKERPANVNTFLEWLGINMRSLEFVIGEKSTFQGEQLKYSCGIQSKELTLWTSKINYTPSDSIADPQSDQHHVVFGKGYPFH